MNLRVRETCRTDFSSILRINRESVPNVSELDADEFSLLLDLCEYSKVVEVDGEIAGYIFALGKGMDYDGEEYNWFRSQSSEDFLYIDQIAIDREWQGRGCGKILYADLENYAVRSRRPTLVCEVNCEPLNQVSMAFHERLGFKELSRMETRGVLVSLLEKRVVRGNKLIPANNNHGDTNEP